MDPRKLKGLYRVAVIGNTGVGKSALCNFLCGKKDGSHKSFPVSGSVDSCTYQTTAQVEKWLGTGHEFVLVDTPGQGDTSGKDSANIADLIEVMKQLQYMNIFLILFNFQSPRLDESLRAMIKILTQMFGRMKFFKNVVLGFTRYDHSAKAERKRQNSGDTRDNREREFNGYFRKAFDVWDSIPAVFIDAYPDNSDKEKMRANGQEVAKLLKLTQTMKPYVLHDIEVVRGHMDQLMDKLKEAEIEAEKNKEEYERKESQIMAELEEERKKQSNRIGVSLNLGPLGSFHLGVTYDD